MPHRIVEIEADARRVAFAGAADDVVALNLIARSDAAVAEDASLMVDRDDGARSVLWALVQHRPVKPRREVFGAERGRQVAGGRRQCHRRVKRSRSAPKTPPRGFTAICPE